MNQPGAPSAGVAGGNEGGGRGARARSERSAGAAGDDEPAEGNERQGNSSDFVSSSFPETGMLLGLWLMVGDEI